MTRLPHIKCIRLCSVRSSHLEFKMHQVDFVHLILPIIMHVGSIATPLFYFVYFFILYHDAFIVNIFFLLKKLTIRTPSLSFAPSKQEGNVAKSVAARQFFIRCAENVSVAMRESANE